MTGVLGSVCRFLNGGTPDKSVPRYFKGGNPWITSADITGPIASDARSFISDEAISKSATNKVPKDAVLLVTRTGVGKVAIAGRELCISQDITALLPDQSKVATGYLIHFLRTKKEHFVSVARGATIKGITRDVVADLSIPLPPLPKQRRIAAILDQADALRTKRREALAQLNSLPQSIFIEMFCTASTDHLGWPKLSLAEAADVLTGYAFKSDEFVGLGKSTVRLCRGTNVMPGRVDWQDLACWPKAGIETLSSFVLAAGDIVMAMDRPWISEGFKIARIAQSDCPALLVQRVARVRARANALNSFLYGLLLQPTFARHCRPTETTIPHISPKEIRLFELRLPPLKLQETFATRIRAVEALKATHRAAQAELDALFASLQQLAFSGGL